MTAYPSRTTGSQPDPRLFFTAEPRKSKNQAAVEAEDDFAAAEVEDAMANVRNEAINQTILSPFTATTFVILLLEEGCANLQCLFYETFVATLN